MTEVDDEIQAKMSELLAKDTKLAQDAINYIFIMLNQESRLGSINQWEYAALVEAGQKGLLKLIFIENYSRDLTLRYSFARTASALLILMYTRVLNGRDRELLIEKYKSQQQIRVEK